MLPANVRLDWKVIASYKHSSLFGLRVSDKGESFITLTSGWEALYLIGYNVKVVLAELTTLS